MDDDRPCLVVNVDAESLQNFRNGLADLPAYAIENFNTKSDPRLNIETQY